MFKWSCLGLALVLAALGGWMINDLRRELKRTTASVNESLPRILDNTRESSETLAELSRDVRELRDLAGVTSGPRDKSLVTYADRILDLIQQSGGQIGLKRLVGKGLKDVQPADEWVIAARKEALWLAFRAKSREEMLSKLCENVLGSPWYIQIGTAEPVLLRDWIEEHLSENRATSLIQDENER